MNIQWIEEEEVMGRLCKWQKCIYCDNQEFTANINIICDECKNTRRKEREQKLVKKESIPNHIRWAVWERDNFTCQHCGTRSNLSVDHIHPESKGGKATMDNCQTLCKSCNSRKGAR